MTDKNENEVPTNEKKPHPLKGRPRLPEVRAKIGDAHRGKAKNYDTWLKGRKGPDHPSYKHGKGSTREYDHEKSHVWILAVKRATNYKCFITGRATDLECHHLMGYAHELTRYLPENGVAICKEIHKEFHNQYGRGGKLPEQLEEFYREKYNITTFPWRQGNHKPSLSIFEANLVSGVNKRAKEFEELVASRGNLIVDGTFVNNSSIFLIKCLKHNTISEVKVQGYKNAAFGVKCGASQKQADTARVNNPLRR